MQESFWGWQFSDRYIICPPPPPHIHTHTPPKNTFRVPNKPCGFCGRKHHVYLLMTYASFIRGCNKFHVGVFAEAKATDHLTAATGTHPAVTGVTCKCSPCGRVGRGGGNWPPDSSSSRHPPSGVTGVTRKCSPCGQVCRSGGGWQPDSSSHRHPPGRVTGVTCRCSPSWPGGPCILSSRASLLRASKEGQSARRSQQENANLQPSVHPRACQSSLH